MAATALEAGQSLEVDGIDAEVIDVRSLQPLDTARIVESVRRTRRVVIAHEAVLFGGLGAEIAATIHAEAFGELAAPIERVGAPFAPVPASPALEFLFVPDASAIADAVRRVLGRHRLPIDPPSRETR
jgi:pyruvate dehydrogenase E1 component beta subunit